MRAELIEVQERLQNEKWTTVSHRIVDETLEDPDTIKGLHRKKLTMKAGGRALKIPRESAFGLYAPKLGGLL